MNPLGPDDPSKSKQSDHMIPLAKPRNGGNISSQNKYKIVTKKPMPQSAIDAFGRWISTQSWDELGEQLSADQLTNKFTNILQGKIDEYFPLKQSKILINSKPWFTHKLRTLSKEKKMIFKKEGRSEKYKEICKEFANARKIAINKFLDKTIDTVTRRNAPGLHRTLKRLGASSGDGDKKKFNLDEHEGLTGQQIADDLGDFFSSISKEFAPLSDQLLPERVFKKNYSPTNISGVPVIEPHQVYSKIKKMNLPESTVPGDFPPRIWKLFSVELSTPIAVIINKILKSGEWTNMFKTEWISVIAKIYDPQDKGDLRNLSLSLFISKLIENIICDMLIENWGHKIDSSQFGGRKGYSVVLYLIKLVDFILLNLDKSMAVLIALIDYSKAYNRQCHNRLLTCYSDLGTPAYLLKILKSYLTSRKMVVRHQGQMSGIYDLPGGGAQGTNIGILNFLVNINSCGVPFDKMVECLRHEHKGQYVGLPVNEGEQPPIHMLGWTKICHPVLPQFDLFTSENQAMFKYIDDMTVAEAIKTSELIPISDHMERLLNYRDRTLHQLPSKSGPLQ